MIRTVWVLAAGGVLTMVLSARLVLARWRRGGREGMEEMCERVGRFWSGSMLRIAGVRVSLEGHEKVDWDQPLVVVANHQSWFDVFALAAHLPGRTRFVAKEELARIPVFGTAWQTCGHVSVNRTDRSRAISTLDRAGQQVRDEGLAMVLFPEGTRSADGRLQPFKKGAFVLAIKTGVPIVPVGISGSREVMPKGSFRIRPGEIRIRVGAPLPVDDLAHRDRARLLAESRRRVALLMEDEGTGPEAMGEMKGNSKEEAAG